MTRIALRDLKVSYNDVGDGGVAVNCEKKTFFLNTLYVLPLFLLSRRLMLVSDSGTDVDSGSATFNGHSK